MSWRWIDRRLLVLLHDESLVMHGGASGLRDAGLLDSALARPLTLVAYGEADLAGLAASYASGLAQNPLPTPYAAELRRLVASGNLSGLRRPDFPNYRIQVATFYEPKSGSSNPADRAKSLE